MKNAKKFTVGLTLCGALLFSGFYNINSVQPIFLYAEPEATEAPASTETPDSTETPTSTNEPEATDIPEETANPENTQAPTISGENLDWSKLVSENSYIINGNEYFSEQNSELCPLTITISARKDLHEDCIISVSNKDHSDYTIEFTLTEDTNYTQTFYLPIGTYIIYGGGLSNSESVQIVSSVSEVKLQDPEIESYLAMAINNVDILVKDEDGTWRDPFPKKTVKEKDDYYYDVASVPDVKTNLKGILSYTVTHTGQLKSDMTDSEKSLYAEDSNNVKCYEKAGAGLISITGNATKDMTLVIVITNPGVVGEATFKLSYDNGKTFTADVTTSDTITDNAHGLVYKFSALNDTDEFVEGDRFVSKVYESYALKSSADGEASRLTCFGHPQKKHTINISVLSTGGCGISRIKVSDANGALKSSVYDIPENGIIEIGDNLTLRFESDANLSKGINYVFEISPSVTKINYMPFYIFIGIISVLFITSLCWLIAKKDKPKDYKIKPYKWAQDESAYR